MDTPLPSRDALKAQARRLRARLIEAGQPMSHSMALEAVAHQWGMRDWNTLCALAGDAPRTAWQIGQRVSGRYLGRRFQGVVKAANQRAQGFWRMTIRFDQPVDVVRSEQFSCLRRQINCSLDARGRSPQKTSDGVPQVILNDHWSRP
ncbi:MULTISPECIES: glyoxalase superfamily protein [unclassified Roseobacter]|uniref:glyoxalase superfamily protein n=1 Tax=uncultured Roseobacter sp. TaxID=114847 RepID=UPI0026310954|nr:MULTISPECIES: glyoxalase superfamily protein [unclassified Roseobacter]MDW3182132.1 glyoxalase superfamily protein [Roseobacter sp.]